MFIGKKGRVEYKAVANIVDFNFDFKIYKDSEVKVYLTPKDKSSVDDRDLLNHTDYTLTNNSNKIGGKITISKTINVDDRITILRDLKIERNYSYSSGKDLNPQTLDDDLDKMVYMIEQLKEELQRTVKLPISSQDISTITLPSPDEMQYIRWSKKDSVTNKVYLENDKEVPKRIITLEKASSENIAKLVSIESELVELKKRTQDYNGAFKQADINNKHTQIELKNVRQKIQTIAEDVNKINAIKNDMEAFKKILAQDKTDIANNVLENKQYKIDIEQDIKDYQTIKSNQETIKQEIEHSITQAKDLAKKIDTDYLGLDHKMDIIKVKASEVDTNTGIVANDKKVVVAKAQIVKEDKDKVEQNLQTITDIKKFVRDSKTDIVAESVTINGYRQEAKNWANYLPNQPVPQGNGNEYSAKHWATITQNAVVSASDDLIKVGVDDTARITPRGFTFGFNYLLNNNAVEVSTQAQPKAGHYVRTLANGKISPTLIPIPRKSFRGTFKPTDVAEYPIITDIQSGDFFIITGLHENTAFTFTKGDLIGKKVFNQMEIMHDSNTNKWHLLGKPDDGSNLYLKITSFATENQALAGQDTQTVISPKTLETKLFSSMMNFKNSISRDTSEADKLVQMDSKGLINPNMLPLGTARTYTLENKRYTIADMHDLLPLGVYCIPNEPNTNHSDMSIFGMEHLHSMHGGVKSAVLIPQRDKAVFMLFGEHILNDEFFCATLMIPEDLATTTQIGANKKISFREIMYKGDSMETHPYKLQLLNNTSASQRIEWIKVKEDNGKVGYGLLTGNKEVKIPTDGAYSLSVYIEFECTFDGTAGVYLCKNGTTMYEIEKPLKNGDIWDYYRVTEPDLKAGDTIYIDVKFGDLGFGLETTRAKSEFIVRQHTS